MYKDLISYQLADNVSEEHLLDIAGNIVKNWMSNQPGFIQWEIHKNNDGGYTDIISWKSKEDAKKAEAAMVNISNAGDWYACYKKESIASKNIHHIGSFK